MSLVQKIASCSIWTETFEEPTQTHNIAFQNEQS